jgi:tight adherence protein B
MLASVGSPAAVAALSGAGVAAIVLAGALGWRAAIPSRRAKRRLRLVRERARGVARPAAPAALSLARQSGNTGIERVAHRWLPRRHQLAARLARTGRKIGLGQYAITCAVLSVLAAATLVGLAPIGYAPDLMIGLAIGVGLPHWVIGRLGRRRIAAFIALFPDAIDLMVRALRSGLPISEAIVNAGHEIADPVGSELRLVEAGMRVGRELDSLLWETASRIEISEFRFFIIALGVQRETGGNLAETLANLADVLRRRRQMAAKVRAMASETRATTMILGGLPIAVVLLLMVTSPAYLQPLYHDIRGYLLDGVAVAMLVTGVTIMNKMAHFEI